MNKRYKLVEYSQYAIGTVKAVAADSSPFGSYPVESKLTYHDFNTQGKLRNIEFSDAYVQHFNAGTEDFDAGTVWINSHLTHAPDHQQRKVIAHLCIF